MPAHMLGMQDIFFWLEKKMAALSELILQMIMYFHAGSHVKPRKVKMCMQMRAGRNEHKKQWTSSLRAFFAFALDTNWLEEKQ